MTRQNAHERHPRPPTLERARPRIPSKSRRPFRVLIGVDFSGASLATARWVARTFGPSAELVLVNVLPVVPDARGVIRAGRAAGSRDDARAMLGALRGLAGLLGVDRVEAVVRRGPVADVLAAVAARVRARYVCIGRDAVDGLPALCLAERLLRRTSAGVIVVPGAADTSPNHVVAVVDGDLGSAAVLREAARVLACVAAAPTSHEPSPETNATRARAAAADSPPSPRAPAVDLLVLARRYRTGGRANGRLEPTAGRDVAATGAPDEVSGTARRGLGALDPVVRVALDRAPCPVLVVPRSPTPSDVRRRIAAGPARRHVRRGPRSRSGMLPRPDMEDPMSVHRPLQHSLPPPGTARALPPVSLALFDGDVLAVWVRGRALGFGGFSEERAAADAALVAYAALSCWVDRRRYAPPPLPATLRPTVCADARDGERWVLADRLPIARLVDPRSIDVDDARGALPPAVAACRSATSEGRGVSSRGDSASDPGDARYGFEVEVPLAVDELGVRSAAYAVYRALCRSGLPWRLRDAGRRARRVDVAAEDFDGPTDPANRRRTGSRFRAPARATPARERRRERRPGA